MRKRSLLVYLACISFLTCCAGQEERGVQVDTTIIDQDLSRLVAQIPIPPPSPAPVKLSEDLSQIETCMLAILNMTSGIEDAQFVTVSNGSEESYRSLQYGYEGNVIRYRVSKSREADRDVYTFGAGIPGLNCPGLDLMFRFAEGLGERCGARIFILCL